MPDPIRLLCPKCGGEHFSTIERLAGYGETSGILATVTEDGIADADIQWTGSTEVDWDSSTTVGVVCRSEGCDPWFYEGDDWSDQLVRSDMTEEVHNA